MNSYLAVIVAVVVLCQSSHCARLEDEVTTLPGLSEPINFRHFSGYLQAGGTRKLHYWFVESQNSPKHDPVLIWLTGGPGCSSMLALLTELGPFHVTNNNDTLYLNPYSWNKVANVLFLDSPAGVGFSYDPSSPYSYSSNDEQTADDNYLAILDFFQGFPELLPNDFYVTGESYGGVYVPMLTERVLRRYNNINLRGYTVGNGALDFALLGNGLIFFGYYHGLWGLSLWTRLSQHCCNGSVSQQACDFVSSRDVYCLEAVNDALSVIRSEGLNVYNLYDPCEYESSGSIANPRASYRHRAWSMVTKSLGWFSQVSDSQVGLTPPCIDEANVDKYLNRPDVKVALHVQESPLNWTSCSNVLNYTMQHTTMQPIVKGLVDSGGLKTLIYNGDVDMACNFLGDEWFVNTLGYQPTCSYKIWKLGKQVAGFFQTYEGNITFATVKGSGHMVPQDKPAQALKMITNFLTDTPF
ncbi:lysosomal protective protein-like [Ornithodoros turicata]|uniref:lysosomal protective protein-like n=1 Tax=Ornithodoros turicata TaxID=34597 RepID=UPI0031398C60